MGLIVPSSPPKGWNEQISKSLKNFADPIRSELDNVKQDYVGTSEPLKMYPLMRWADTTASVLKVRNLANDAWITLYPLDTAYGGFAHDSEVVKIAGTQTITGEKTFSIFPITPSSAPDADYEVANKKYVDDKPAVAAASQAEQEAGTEAGKYVAPATAQNHPSAAKAWCFVSGGATPSLDAGYNVTSITDVDVGRFLANFTVAFSSVNYVMAGAANSVLASYYATLSFNGAPAADHCHILICSATVGALDSAYWSAAFYGDQ